MQHLLRRPRRARRRACLHGLPRRCRGRFRLLRDQDRFSPDQDSRFPADYGPLNRFVWQGDPGLRLLHDLAHPQCNRRRHRGLPHLRRRCGRSRHGRALRDNRPCVPSFRRGRILPPNFPSLGRRDLGPPHLRDRAFRCARRVHPCPGNRFIEVPSGRGSPSYRAQVRDPVLQEACVREDRGPCIRLRGAAWWRRVWPRHRSNSSGALPISAARVHNAIANRSRKRKSYGL